MVRFGKINVKAVNTILSLFILLFTCPIALSQEIITRVENATSCTEMISVPVTVQNCYGVAAISLVLQFDNTMLSYTGYQNKHPSLGGFFFVNENNGSIILSWASLNPINISFGTLIEYNFVSTGGVSFFYFDTLTSGSCEYSNGNGNVLPAQFINGQTAVSQPGLVAHAGSDVTITCGEAVELTASASGGIPPYTFEWSTDQTAQTIILVPYQSTIVSLNVFDSINCSGSDDVFINVLPASNQQIVSLHKGWNGLSSFIDATDPLVETIFLNAISEVVILADRRRQIFWPEGGINTIIDWNTNSGYMIKVKEGLDLSFYGSTHQGKTIQLNEGWNLIPVLSECNVDVLDLMEGSDVVIVQEVAGRLIFWPEMQIHTLEYLEPGSAYFVLMENGGEIVFPDCQ